MDKTVKTSKNGKKSHFCSKSAICDIRSFLSQTFKQAGNGISRRHIQGSKIAKGLKRILFCSTRMRKTNSFFFSKFFEASEKRRLLPGEGDFLALFHFVHRKVSNKFLFKKVSLLLLFTCTAIGYNFTKLRQVCCSSYNFRQL